MKKRWGTDLRYDPAYNPNLSILDSSWTRMATEGNQMTSLDARFSRCAPLVTERSIRALRALVLLLAITIFVGACGEKPKETSTSSGSVASTPAVAKKYEGKIVRQPPANRGKDDGWYLVRNGKRQWIVDAAWLGRNGYSVESVIEIPSADFNAISEDPTPLS